MCTLDQSSLCQVTWRCNAHSNQYESSWTATQYLLPFFCGVRYVVNSSLSPLRSAMDTELNKRVAVKKLTRAFDTSELAKRSYRELRILKHMKHENVGWCV